MYFQTIFIICFRYADENSSEGLFLIILYDTHAQAFIYTFCIWYFRLLA